MHQAREEAAGAPTAAERAEIRELARVRRERDILGKSNRLLLNTRPEERVMTILFVHR